MGIISLWEAYYYELLLPERLDSSYTKYFKTSFKNSKLVPEKKQTMSLFLRSHYDLTLGRELGKRDDV
jgi:hypothetical protein